MKIFLLYRLINERWMWNYLKPRKDNVFIDIGAHIGKYALQVAKIVGEKGFEEI